MNKKTVGIENLPNVYIDNIEIDSNTLSPDRTQHKIEVTIMMVDNSESPTWFDRIADLKVKCAFVADDRIAKLNNEGLSLHSFSPSSLLDFTKVESCSEFQLYKTEGGYSYYRKVFEMTIINPSNLNVYAACFVDNLGFGIDLFDKFYGPMAGERIFVSGQINEDSGYFYYPDTNEEYGGPVHPGNQGYMEGSEHSDRSHSDLVYVAEQNYKITSNQTFDLDFDVVFGLGDIGIGAPTTFVTPNGVPVPLQPNSVTEVNPNVPTSPLTEIQE